MLECVCPEYVWTVSVPLSPASETPPVTIGFELAAYSTVENSGIPVRMKMMVLDGELTSSVVVRVFTVDGTATGEERGGRRGEERGGREEFDSSYNTHTSPQVV